MQGMEAVTLKTAAMREKLASVPVIKSGLSLMTGTMVTSGLGLIFWVLAANLYDAADFGVSTTAVYTMIMLADVACLGLRTGLVRYLPRAGIRTGKTVLWGYGLVLVASTITAVLFLAGLQWWAPDLIELRNSGLMFIFFVASTAFWALFMLEDAVLVGFRKAPWVPIENSLFGILKIVLLFPFAVWSPTLGIFWAWTLPVFPIVIGINVFVARVAKARSAPSAAAPDVEPVESRKLLRDILAFSIADWFAAVARLVALGVIPLMVLAQLDQAQAGYFQASWLMAFTIFALSSNAAYALLAETSYEQNKLHRNSIQAGLLSLALTVPVILIGVIGAPLLLRIYGADYSANSATVLRILLIAAVPNVVHQIYVGRLRSQGRMVAVVVLETMLSVLVVGLAWLFLPRYGIDGVGYAWLIGLVALSLYAGACESQWWWAGKLDTRIVRSVGSALRRLRASRPARGLRSRLDKVLSSVDNAGSAVAWMHSGDDGQTAIVATTGHRELVVDFARSTEGAAELDRRHRTIRQLRDDPRLHAVRGLLPELRAYDQTSDEEYLLSSRPAGSTALDLVNTGTPIEVVCDTVLERLQPLHRLAGPVMVDAETIDGWIEAPVERLATSGRASPANLENLRQVLIDGFADRLIDVGPIHGELALDNIVMSIDPPAVDGLLRWEQSAELPVVVDRATLALSDLANRHDAELGEIVRSLLRDPAPFDDHPAISSDHDRWSNSRPVILLAWLSLVGRPQPPRQTIASDGFWLARNARPVLVDLQPVAGARP